MALTDRASLLASRVAAEVKSLWAAVESKADADHNHDGAYAKPADLPDVSDVIREGDPRLTDDRDPTAHTHDDRYYTETEVDTALNGKAAASHTHAEYVETTDPRLSDARTPTAHNHAISNVSGLQSALDGKAASSHSHSAADVGAVPTSRTVNSKALSANISLSAADVGAAPASHSHAISNVTGLQSALDGKAASSHTHDDRYYTEAEVNTALGGKANTSHTHTEYAPATQTINAQTGTTYTLAASDAGKVVTASNASPVTITVRASTFGAGKRVDVLQRGAGSVTFAAGSGMTLRGTPSLVTRDQWSAASVLFLSATEAVVIGDLATP